MFEFRKVADQLSDCLLAPVLIHLKSTIKLCEGCEFLSIHDMLLWPKPAPVKDHSRKASISRLDDLTKPQGSLGYLEHVIAQLAAVQGRAIPALVHPHLLVFAADHGVASNHSVSRYKQSVTEEMCVNIAMGGSASAVLARGFGMETSVVDVGVASLVRHPNVIVRKVGFGTSDLTKGPAMNIDQFKQALDAGISEANRVIIEGADCLILGEMGIANTTSASALSAWLLGQPVEDVVGHGTGIDEAHREAKVRLIEGVLNAFHEFQSDASQTTEAARYIDGFRYLGGFELVAMAGAMLAAGAKRIPVLLDGVLAGVAALWAARVEPSIRAYFIAGHLSPEPAHAKILEALGLSPILSVGLRIGEGTGALFAWPVLNAALKVMAETSTFADARVTNPHRKADSDTLEVDSQEPMVRKFVVHSQSSVPPVLSGFTEAERLAVYKAILARRDIRVFLPDAIDSDALTRILQAGHHGPSVGYMQPWNFIVITDRDVKQRLQAVVEKERVQAGQAYADAKRDYYLRLKVEGLVQAPVTICVTNDSMRGGPHVLGRSTIPETDLMSTSCAIENMWLAARAEGIGMGWVSIYEKADVREILGIPNHVDPSAILSLGYTPHFPDIPVLERVGWGTRLDMDDLVFANQWGNRMGDEG